MVGAGDQAFGGWGSKGVVMIGGALLCVALAGGGSLGAAAAGQPGAAAGRRQFELAQRVGRTKQLESEAMREAALARLEAKVSRGCVRAIAAAHGPLQAAPPGPASLQASEGGMPSAAPSALQGVERRLRMLTWCIVAVQQRVKALQKELLSIKAKKSAPHAAQQSLNGDSDMQNGQREKVRGGRARGARAMRDAAPPGARVRRPTPCADE